MARRYLERALSAVDDYETHQKANFYLSKIENDPALKRKYLKEVLAGDPLHPEARRALAILDGRLKPEEIVNPDSLPAAKVGTIDAQADRYTCPTCGGRMAFAPDGQTLACDFCTGRQALAPTLAEEQDFLLDMATAKGHLRSEAIHTFHCKGCGADFILPPDALSATCAYCGSHHVVSLEERSELVPPQAILPFAFDRDQAAHFLLDWLKQNSLRPDRKPEPPRGVYVPVWTFDLAGEIPWSYQVSNQCGGYETVSGRASLHFDDVPVIASRRVPQWFGEVLKGYSLPRMVTYDPRYLADWPAQTYEISMSDASLEARAWAVQQGREEARRLNASALSGIADFQTAAPRIAVASYKLALVSVWLAKYEIAGQTYEALLDSQTGKVYAEKPGKGGLLGWFEGILGE
jgi:DNA-directed RNA polymerase subunit RPC12/RpoP